MAEEEQELQPSESYRRDVERYQDFKDRVHSLLKANYAGVVRDVPNGRHILEFGFEENFFGFTRKWRVVTASGDSMLPYERAIRIVGAHKDDIEQHNIDGVLVVTEVGADKFATDFLASSQGFLHRTIDDLATQKPISDEVLSINKNDPAYSETTAKIEKTKDLLQGDNNSPLPVAVIKRLIAEFEAMLRLLKESEIRADLVATLIISALKSVVKTLGNNAAGIAAAGALIAVEHLFGFR